ncbi:MAG: TRAP transporter small permease [Treponema sp.]|jgi:TRAP-type C4-dicarboxylate transport system permease small subunit|nr:TRAP transporter small permease [Treponema sp.]
MNSVGKKLERQLGFLAGGINILAGITIGVFMSLLFFQVFMRFVFNSPIFGLDEMVTALMIWSMALGCPTVYWANEHAVIEALLKLFPSWGKKIVYHLTNLTVLVTSLVYVPGGIVLFKMQNRLRPVGGLPFSKAWYYALPVTVMGVLLVIFALYKTIAYIATGEDRLVKPVTGEEGGVTLD